MDITWATVLIAIGLLVVIVGVAKKMKKSSRKTWFFFGATVGIIGLVAMSGAVSQLAGLNQNINFGSTLTISPEDQGLNVDVTGCDLGTKTTVTLSATDKYTSLPVGGYHRYRINGAPAVDIADQGTFTASPGDKITVLWNNATTTGYYSSVGTYTVPCAGAKTFYTESANNGTLSSSLKDSDDVTIDGSANNQTLSAGDVKDVSMKLSGQYEKDFTYGFVAVVEYNNTAIDNVILSTESGTELSSATVLQSYASTYGTVSSKKAYLVPAILSNADLRLKVTIDADDSVDPSVGTANVLVELYPENYFINEKNGGAFEGPAGEDEDNTLTRAGGFLETIYVD